MRISDWSSDVCSSDLGIHIRAPDGRQFRHHLQPLECGLERQPRSRRCRRRDRVGVYRERAIREDREGLRFPGGLYKRLSRDGSRSEEHTSELQSLMRISYAVFCFKKKKKKYTK